jgi:hypothetical protein
MGLLIHFAGDHLQPNSCLCFVVGSLFVQRFKGLRAMLRTLMVSLPTLLNVGALLL